MAEPTGDGSFDEWAPQQGQRRPADEYLSPYDGSARPPVTEPILPSRSDSFNPGPVRIQIRTSLAAGFIISTAGLIALLVADSNDTRVPAVLVMVFAAVLAVVSARQLGSALHLHLHGDTTLGLVEAQRFLTTYNYEVEGRTYRRRQWLTGSKVTYQRGDHIWVAYKPDRPGQAAPVVWVRQVVLVAT